MKNILFISHSSEFGGAEKFLFDIATHLDQTRYKVHVCYPEFGSQMSREKFNSYSNITLSALPYKSAMSISPNILRRIANALSHLWCSLMILKLIKKENIDVVVSNSSSVCVGSGGALLGRIPHVWIIHEDIGRSGPQFILGNTLYKKIIGRGSRAVVFNSQWTWKQYSMFIPAYKSRIIYNGYDFESLATKLKNNDESGATLYHIGIVGTICENKGQLEAVKAAEILYALDTRYKLHIFGTVTDSQYCNEVRRYIQVKNLTECVIFEGYISETSDIYSKVGIVLVPSKVESFGRVVVEGIYFGCIVIAASVGGICEIVKNYTNGILLDAIRPESIAQAVLSLIGDQKLVYRIRENAHRSIVKYSLDCTLESIVELLEDVSVVSIQH